MGAVGVDRARVRSLGEIRGNGVGLLVAWMASWAVRPRVRGGALLFFCLLFFLFPFIYFSFTIFYYSQYILVLEKLKSCTKFSICNYATNRTFKL